MRTAENLKLRVLYCQGGSRGNFSTRKSRARTPTLNPIQEAGQDRPNKTKTSTLLFHAEVGPVRPPSAVLFDKQA